ncbi:hypothetical protein VCHA53O466_50453 [Vibrio chagasii]|nr:hypothetical protein VCHA53O466_50453 [Vibrio chagasii]
MLDWMLNDKAAHLNELLKNPIYQAIKLINSHAITIAISVVSFVIRLTGDDSSGFS